MLKAINETIIGYFVLVLSEWIKVFHGAPLSDEKSFLLVMPEICASEDNSLGAPTAVTRL